MHLKRFVPALILVSAVSMSVAGNSTGQTVFKGSITDSICARAGSHSEAMDMSKDMGKTAAQCTIACVEQHGAKYVLFVPEGKKTYRLSDQNLAKKFAGQSVKVAGTLNKNEIEVQSIAAAE